MYSKAILTSILVAVVQARFGQEQLPISAISNVKGGSPGVAQTLAGQTVSTLLGASNPCDKLKQADEIITKLGTGSDALEAAKGLVAAEQNFNPSTVSIPAICNDPSLPATAELRGIVPLVDPAVAGADIENANSAKSKTTPFNASGKSVADVMATNGFNSFSTVDASGKKGTAPGATGSAADGAATDGKARASTKNADDAYDEAGAAGGAAKNANARNGD